MKKLVIVSLVVVLSLLSSVATAAADSPVPDPSAVLDGGGTESPLPTPEPPGPPPPPENPDEGAQWLGMLVAWLVFGGGASYLTYKLVEEVRRLRQLPPKQKRFAAMGIAGSLAVAGYLFAVAMLYQTAPETWRAWVEQLVYVFGIGAAGSQVAHGLALPGRRKLDVPVE